MRRTSAILKKGKQLTGEVGKEMHCKEQHAAAGAWTEGQLGRRKQEQAAREGDVWGLWATCGVFCVLRVVRGH